MFLRLIIVQAIAFILLVGLIEDPKHMDTFEAVLLSILVLVVFGYCNWKLFKKGDEDGD